MFLHLLFKLERLVANECKSFAQQMISPPKSNKQSLFPRNKDFLYVGEFLATLILRIDNLLLSSQMVENSQYNYISIVALWMAMLVDRSITLVSQQRLNGLPRNFLQIFMCCIQNCI